MNKYFSIVSFASAAVYSSLITHSEHCSSLHLCPSFLSTQSPKYLIESFWLALLKKHQSHPFVFQKFIQFLSNSLLTLPFTHYGTLFPPILFLLSCFLIPILINTFFTRFISHTNNEDHCLCQLLEFIWEMMNYSKCFCLVAAQGICWGNENW